MDAQLNEKKSLDSEEKNNNDIYIKARRARGAFFFVISLLFLCASVYCLFLSATGRFIPEYVLYFRIAYFAIGTIGVGFFAYKTTFNLMRLINPLTAVVISEVGLYDYTIPDGGIAFVAWDNIADIKLFGKKKCDWLGLSLKTTSKVFLGLNKRAKQDIRDNIDSGLPAVILKSEDIGIDLYELRSMINENIRRVHDADKTKIISPRKPTVSQVYGKPSETAPEETISINTLSQTLTDSNAITVTDIKDEEQLEIALPLRASARQKKDHRSDEAELELTFFTADTTEPSADLPEKNEDESEVLLEVQESAKTRTIEIPKRPETRKNIKNDDIDNIDDILSALSKNYKSKSDKKDGYKAKDDKDENKTV